MSSERDLCCPFVCCEVPCDMYLNTAPNNQQCLQCGQYMSCPCPCNFHPPRLVSKSTKSSKPTPISEGNPNSKKKLNQKDCICCRDDEMPACVKMCCAISNRPCPKPNQCSSNMDCEFLQAVRDTMEGGVKESIEELFHCYFMAIGEKVDMLNTQLMRQEHMLLKNNKAVCDKFLIFKDKNVQQIKCINNSLSKFSELILPKNEESKHAKQTQKQHKRMCANGGYECNDLYLHRRSKSKRSKCYQ